MIISLNWLKKFTNVDLPIDELAQLIGARLVEIEDVINIGAKYDNVLAVKVVECSPVEGSDHLSLVKIDDGGVSKVERDNNGLIQVVCGAPNIAVGQLVVWLQPGCVLPNTLYSDEPFVLGTRKLQGVDSNGMIASAKELDLFDEHEGILVLDKDIKPGTLFTDAYELNDYLLDIENKSLTHRPDCFSIIGFAREVAAISGAEFKTPDWLNTLDPDFPKPTGNIVDLQVKIDDSKLADRYQAIVVSGADSKRQSPLQIQTYLSRVGVRPINAVVDVTNYLMMLAGQPLHAFDYDKVVSVAGGKADIHVRSGKEGEKLELLDGRIIELTPEDIVIAAGETAVALAGAMGGANTEIDSNTKNIIIEAATFNLFNLRATQFRHGIFSEAITRFTKGQPADQTAPVLFDAVRLMNEWAGATVVSNVADDYPAKNQPIKIEFTSHQINQVLGSDYKYPEVAEILKRAEFTVEERGNSLEITVPYWRKDIHIVEDIAEEVGRLNGYDNINPDLPNRNFTAVKPNDFDIFRTKVRNILTRAGANEVLTYTFVPADLIKKAGQNPDYSYKVVNSISPDLQYYRQSLTPSLLNLVHPNIKQGFDEFAIFELNKIHSKTDKPNNEGVPIEWDMLALVYSNKNSKKGSAYFQAKRFLDYLIKELGIDSKLTYQKLHKSGDQVQAALEPLHSAYIVESDGHIDGMVGEYKHSVVKSFKLPEYTSGFEVDLNDLYMLYKNTGNRYQPISKYPSAERDLCFKVDKSVQYSDVYKCFVDEFDHIGFQNTITPIDIYSEPDSETKNVTIRIKMAAYDHTLTSEEVGLVVEDISTLIQVRLSGVLI